MEWLIIALVVIALIACYAGAICEMKREIRKANTAARKYKKALSDESAQLEELENKLLRLEQREAERRAAYRLLSNERDELERQLKIKTAIIEKLDEKISRPEITRTAEGCTGMAVPVTTTDTKISY